MTASYFKMFTTFIKKADSEHNSLKWHFPGKVSGNNITIENILKCTRMQTVYSTNTTISVTWEKLKLIFFFSLPILGFYFLVCFNAAWWSFHTSKSPAVITTKALSLLFQLLEVSRCSLNWNSSLKFQTCGLFQTSKTFPDLGHSSWTCTHAPQWQPPGNPAIPLPT